jgi:two-component system cell cycle response regulator
MSSEETRITGYQPPSGGGSGWLVVVHAPPLQRRLLGAHLPLGGGEVTLGRDVGCDLVLDAEDVSRRHARVRAAGAGHEVEDLGSTNGTFVGGVQVASRALAAGDLIRLGSVVVKYLAGGDLEALYVAELKRLAEEDPLTGIAHRGAFDQALSREVARARRHGNPLALAILDVDHFKAVNDRHGHLAGDLVLRELSELVRPLVRAEQLFARVGGEELALLLPDVTLEKAALFAEKVRRLVEEHASVFDGQRISVTVSIGIAALEPGDLAAEALLARADARLYQAKREGRNRVSCR